MSWAHWAQCWHEIAVAVSAPPFYAVLPISAVPLPVSSFLASAVQNPFVATPSALSPLVRAGVHWPLLAEI